MSDKLTEFIVESQDNGLNDQQIFQYLQAAGWKEKDINDAFNRLNSKNSYNNWLTKFLDIFQNKHKITINIWRFFLLFLCYSVISFFIFNIESRFYSVLDGWGNMFYIMVTLATLVCVVFLAAIIRTLSRSRYVFINIPVLVFVLTLQSITLIFGALYIFNDFFWTFYFVFLSSYIVSMVLFLSLIVFSSIKYLDNQKTNTVKKEALLPIFGAAVTVSVASFLVYWIISSISDFFNASHYRGEIVFVTMIIGIVLSAYLARIYNNSLLSLENKSKLIKNISFTLICLLMLYLPYFEKIFFPLIFSVLIFFTSSNSLNINKNENPDFLADTKKGKKIYYSLIIAAAGFFGFFILLKWLSL